MRAGDRVYLRLDGPYDNVRRRRCQVTGSLAHDDHNWRGAVVRCTNVGCEHEDCRHPDGTLDLEVELLVADEMRGLAKIRTHVREGERVGEWSLD